MSAQMQLTAMIAHLNSSLHLMVLVLHVLKFAMNAQVQQLKIVLNVILVTIYQNRSKSASNATKLVPFVVVLMIMNARNAHQDTSLIKT